MMPAAMNAKGLREPEVSFWIDTNKGVRVYLHWKKADDDRWSMGKSETFIDDKGDPVAMLDEADAFIRGLPSIEETGKAEFMAALAKAIEIGKERHIDTDLMVPVIASWKKLAENVIEDKRGVAK